MKITLTIDDAVMSQVKRESLRQGKTVSEIVESALRVFLPRGPKRAELPPLPQFDGGACLVDVADRGELYRVMQDR
jgi:hypothetical protein